MTEDEEKALDQVMTANLSRAIDFVKYAETKNAAVLTFASAWLLASVTAALNPTAAGIPEIQFGLTFGGPFLAASALTALWSLIPRIDLKALMGSREETSNLLFFGDIAKRKAADVGDAIRDRYVASLPLGRRLSDAYFSDLGCQIAVNSQLARKKFHRFHFAVACLFGGLGLYLFSVLNLFI